MHRHKHTHIEMVNIQRASEKRSSHGARENRASDGKIIVRSLWGAVCVCVCAPRKSSTFQVLFDSLGGWCVLSLEIFDLLLLQRNYVCICIHYVFRFVSHYAHVHGLVPQKCFTLQLPMRWAWAITHPRARARALVPHIQAQIHQKMSAFSPYRPVIILAICLQWHRW